MNSINMKYGIEGGKYTTAPASNKYSSCEDYVSEYCPACTGRVIIEDQDKYFCGYCNTELKKG